MIETVAGRMPAYTETLPRVADSVHRARRLVRLALEVWGLTGGQDDAELLVSELLTNAVLHARRGNWVRVTVTRLGEGGSGSPWSTCRKSGRYHGVRVATKGPGGAWRSWRH